MDLGEERMIGRYVRWERVDDDNQCRGGRNIKVQMVESDKERRWGVK